MSDNQIKNPKVGGVNMAEVPKEHLRLPQLHFISAMDWIDKLGDTAFCAYLKLFTLADRKGKSLKRDEAKIKDSLTNVQKELGISRGTFYNKVIEPLWSYCLIDLETYEESKMKKNAQKPVNIIVYPYPNMEFERMVQPLEKLRDYKTDYNSEARIHARKKPKKTDIDTVQNLDGIVIGNKEEKPDFNTVQNLDGGPSKNRTGDRLKNEQNNLSNNSFNNVLNSFNNVEEEEEEIVPSILDNPSLKLLNELAIQSGFNEDLAMDLVICVNEKGITNLNESVIMEAFRLVQKDIDNGKEIVEWDKWTAGKIERVAKRPQLNLHKSDNGAPNSKQPKTNYGRKPVREEIKPDWMGKEAKEMDPSDEVYNYLKTKFKDENPNAAESELSVWMDEKYKLHGVAEFDYQNLKSAIVQAEKEQLQAKWAEYKKSVGE